MENHSLPYLMIQTSQYEFNLLQEMNSGEPSPFYSSSTHSNVIEEVNINLVLHSLTGHLGIIGHTNSSGKAARSFRLCLWPDPIAKSHILITLAT